MAEVSLVKKIKLLIQIIAFGVVYATLINMPEVKLSGLPYVIMIAVFAGFIMGKIVDVINFCFNKENGDSETIAHEGGENNEESS